MNYITNILLQIEERSRKFFERIPFIHAFFAGVGVVLFWRGVWHIADTIELPAVTSLIVGLLLLGGLGMFLHTMVGNAIIIKNVERDATLSTKTSNEIFEVEANLAQESLTLEALKTELTKIHDKLDSMK